MVKNANVIKNKIIAAERALFYISTCNPGGDDTELIDEVRGMLSVAMELLDNEE